MNTVKILDLGCGLNKRRDAIGIDNVALSGVDIVHDLTRFPYPIETASIEQVCCNHILEHFDSEMLIKVLTEVQRILKPGGLLEIRVPHAFCIAAKTDPTHKSFYCFQTIKYFTPDFEYSYYKNTPKKFRVKKTWANFGFSLKTSNFFEKSITSLLGTIFNKVFDFKGFAPDIFVKLSPFFSVEIFWVLERLPDSI